VVVCQRGAMTRPEDFYDDLASEYHLLFGDWWLAALDHAQVISGLLVEHGVAVEGSRLLDCTCGIGTQALPLAALGYDVTATDISALSVERARAEAERRNLRLRFAVADVRRVDEVIVGPFDSAISCDNALPHLLTDADLNRAIRSIRTCLRDGAVFLASIRDYDTLAESRPTGTPLLLHGIPDARHGTGQAWEWSDDRNTVNITLFILVESPDHAWRVSTRETTYRVLRRQTLTAALHNNGFVAVKWLMPHQSGYYQPVVIAVAA
jgi:glycine/sarcosine N-methyltransferase